MSLELVKTALRANITNTSVDAFVGDEQMRGDKVALFRRYMDGDHDSNLTTEMSAMLRITSGDTLNEFNDNYCATIVDTMVDRIKLLAIESGDELVDQWISDLLEINRFDALQIDTSEATVRDGNTFLLIHPEPDENGVTRIQMTHEPAFDGTEGMVVLYERRGAKKPLVAVKVWQVTTQEIADTTRVNVYYPDRLEKYVSLGGAALAAFTDDDDEGVVEWMVDGQPIGVPVIHFRNSSSGYDNHGLSQLDNVVPLQNALNRTLHSMVAASELSGFNILLAIGFQMTSGMTPGQYFNVFPSDGSLPSAESAPGYNAVRLERVQGGDITTFVNQAQWLIEQMFRITNTPDDNEDANLSGESRKQREVKLLGKIERFHIKNGNAWEDAIRMCARVGKAFAVANTPDLSSFMKLSAKWKDPQLRNDDHIVQNALAEYQAGVIDQREYLERVRDIYEYTDEKIDAIIERTQQGGQTQFSPGDMQRAIAQTEAAGLQTLTTGLTPEVQAQAEAEVTNGVS